MRQARLAHMGGTARQQSCHVAKHCNLMITQGKFETWRRCLFWAATVANMSWCTSQGAVYRERADCSRVFMHWGTLLAGQLAPGNSMDLVAFMIASPSCNQTNYTSQTLMEGSGLWQARGDA